MAARIDNLKLANEIKQLDNVHDSEMRGYCIGLIEELRQAKQALERANNGNRWMDKLVPMMWYVLGLITYYIATYIATR